MAHFYGTLQGNRGEATRSGSKDSGLTAVAASWDGAVKTTLHYDEATGLNHYRVETIPWRGKGERELLAEGSF